MQLQWTTEKAEASIVRGRFTAIVKAEWESWSVQLLLTDTSEEVGFRAKGDARDLGTAQKIAEDIAGVLLSIALKD